MMDWNYILVAGMTVVVTQGFNYFRTVKKDVNTLTLATLDKTLKEQERFQRKLMDRLDEQDRVIAKLKKELDGLTKENQDLRNKNTKLEKRIRELENELKRYHDEREALLNGKGD